MKKLFLSVILISCVTSYANPSFRVLTNQPLPSFEQAEPRLVLETSIAEERYQVEHGNTMLRWNLTLTYTNAGAVPILLYKKSSLIYRSMVSKTLKAASKEQYEADTNSHFISVDAMRAAGFLDRLPEEADFVTLKPGEWHSVQAIYGVRPRRNSTDDSGLAPGKYFIEVKVATWYYYADPKEYRLKWRDNGYLWFQNIKSEPMSFSVQ